jgi:hypothetical protein
MTQLWPVGNYVSGPDLPSAPVFSDLITDADAQSYIAQVESADGQSLEEGVKISINNLILGLKGHNLWSNLNHLLLLSGPRTLNGLLVPVKGTAPTLNNFTIDDYNRKTGIVGDGSSKYINSNVKLTDMFASDGGHIGVRVVRSTLLNSAYMGAKGSTTSTGSALLGVGGTSTTIESRVLMVTTQTITNTLRHDADGFYCVNKQAGAGYYVIYPNQQSGVGWTLSTTTTSTDIYVLANNNNGTADSYSNGRVGLYLLGKGFPSGSADATNLKTIIDRYFTDLNSVTLT